MGIKFNMMLSSPADRALETAHRVATAVHYPYPRIRISDALYSSETTRTLVTQIQKLDPKFRVVALCGHNPAIDNLAAHFVPTFSGSVEKGAMLGISLRSESWRKVAKGSGSIRFFVTPSEVATTKRQPKHKRQPHLS
jgi:phosphohistidine phosphatase